MGLACVLAGCVATLAMLHGPALSSRASAARAPVAAASTASESELRAVREELASLRQHASEMEARQRAERLTAEVERARTLRLLDEERERRIRADGERDRALEERPSISAPMVVAWPAAPPVMTPVMTSANLRAMLTQQLLQQMAIPVTPEPWPDTAP